MFVRLPVNMSGWALKLLGLMFPAWDFTDALRCKHCGQFFRYTVATEDAAIDHAITHIRLMHPEKQA